MGMKIGDLVYINSNGNEAWGLYQGPYGEDLPSLKKVNLLQVVSTRYWNQKLAYWTVYPKEISRFNIWE